MWISFVLMFFLVLKPVYSIQGYQMIVQLMHQQVIQLAHNLMHQVTHQLRHQLIHQLTFQQVTLFTHPTITILPPWHWHFGQNVFVV